MIENPKVIRNSRGISFSINFRHLEHQLPIKLKIMFICYYIQYLMMNIKVKCSFFLLMQIKCECKILSHLPQRLVLVLHEFERCRPQKLSSLYQGILNSTVTTIECKEESKKRNFSIPICLK